MAARRCVSGGESPVARRRVAGRAAAAQVTAEHRRAAAPLAQVRLEGPRPRQRAKCAYHALVVVVAFTEIRAKHDTLDRPVVGRVFVREVNEVTGGVQRPAGVDAGRRRRRDEYDQQGRHAVQSRHRQFADTPTSTTNNTNA